MLYKIYGSEYRLDVCFANVSGCLLRGGQKLNYTGGGVYMNGQQFYQPQPSQAIVGGNTLMPMYPLYHFHQSHTMGVPAHMYQPITAGHFATVPALISKPNPNAGT